MIALVLLAMCAGLGLLVVSRLLASRTNMASSAVRLSDMSADGRVLYSRKYRIYGKPDYVISEQEGGKTVAVAVEVKPSRRSRRLYESDELQAVAYALLLRDNFPDAASYARVSYAPGIPSFRVDLTPERIRRLVTSRDEILASRKSGVSHRSHSFPARCAACGFRHSCGESMA